MKKLLAILLALMMVLVSVAALAGEEDENGGQKAGTAVEYEPGVAEDDGTSTVGSPRLAKPLDNGGSITLDKEYTTLILEGAKLPVTDIAFTATLESISDSTVKVADMASKKVSVSYTNPTSETELDASEDTYTDPNKITIQFPEYPEVGIYTYTLAESGSDIAGVTYSGDLIMKVTVVRLEGVLKIAGIAFRETETGDKLDAITNEYEAGTLEVKKIVSGNMGEQNRDFEITVTFTAQNTVKSTIGIETSTNAKIVSGATNNTIATPWTGEKVVKFTLQHNDTITFTNVPAGVQYAVTEADYTGTAYGYEAAKIINGSGTMAHSKVASSVENKKDKKIDTGVTLDSAVYMLIMALALAGFVALKVRRREEN